MPVQRICVSVLVLCALVGLLTVPSGAAELTLVRDGRPAATIVVASDAGDKVKSAAEELQAYLAKMSGATLPLVTDAGDLEGALILVGPSSITATLGIEIPSGVTPSRREEGFVLWCDGKRLVLAGNNDGPYHGTEYAVYEFLNRLGVRWFMPGEFGEVVPERTTITVAPMQVESRPDFLLRDWWCHMKPEIAEQERRWKLRNKMNPDHGDFFYVPSDSSVRRVLHSDLVDEKPELFALKPDGSRDPHYPNLTNPDAVSMVAGKVKEWLRNHPEATSYGFAPDDGLPRDFNPETLKQSLGLTILGGRPGVPTEMSVTEEWFRFVNQVIAQVHGEFPGVYLATNGYANRNNPPLGVALDDHLVVMFAAIWSCTLHGYDADNCWQKNLQGKMLERWAELCPNVWVYGYNYNMLVSGLSLVPELTKLRRDFPLMKKWGVIGFMDETRNVWAESGIASRYLRAQLEWDADADVDEILADFFATWYGPGGEAMEAYYVRLDAAVANSPVHGHEDRCLGELYTPALMRALRRDIERAENAVTSEPYLSRVRAERLIFDHLQAYVRMTHRELAGDFAGAARYAQQVLDVRPPLHEISPFFIWPDEDGYHTGVWYWKIIDRLKWYQGLSDRMTGVTGDLVAKLGPDAAFKLDPNDEGVYGEWFEPGFPTEGWTTVPANRPFYTQGYRDAQGRPYVGNMWYRFRVTPDSKWAGRDIALCFPLVSTEGWCWVNGEFVGYRPYQEAYIRPSMMQVDVTAAIKLGVLNEIVVRVSTSLSAAQDAEGIYCRPFLYAPR